MFPRLADYSFLKNPMSVFKFAIALHLVLPFSGQCFGQYLNAYDGIMLDANETSGIMPWTDPSTGRTSVQYATMNGGLNLYSYGKESSKGKQDGGINLWGNPVTIVLATDKDDETNWGSSDKGVFNIWKKSKYFSTSPTAKPLFEVDSLNGTAVFDSVNVSVNNGSLSVGGSPVLTEAGLGSALSSATPPVSTAWQGAYLSRGNVSNGGLWAAGTATASGSYSIAYGSGTTVASGAYSEAAGTSAKATGGYSNAKGFIVTASGNYSSAWGSNAEATGTGSVAFGLGVKSQSSFETVFGFYNLIDSSPSPTARLATDSLFRLGNGTGPTDLSDAVDVRKNGQTTLINKAWKSGTSGPLEDPGATDDAGGEALVVDGHARLRGKVIIEQAQGDIGMGIYE